MFSIFVNNSFLNRKLERKTNAQKNKKLFDHLNSLFIFYFTFIVLADVQAITIMPLLIFFNFFERVAFDDGPDAQLIPDIRNINNFTSIL